ncbi:unnamed protein product [Polarella glacialis]|uniref:Uncharacterized protein n=1 Tax=Polarella glacialis TaxID=89957 RepID=A0A813IW30_POLGL|nr:unnamed protein product [Polarella glacialis]
MPPGRPSDGDARRPLLVDGPAETAFTRLWLVLLSIVQQGCCRRRQISSLPGAASSAGTSVVWISVDPRGGQLSFYPGEVAKRLELGRLRGETSVELGPSYFNATVSVQEDPPVQYTSRGRRDVRRLTLTRPDDIVVVRVVSGRRGWRAAAEGEGEERTSQVPDSSVVEVTPLEEAARLGLDLSDASPQGSGSDNPAAGSCDSLMDPLDLVAASLQEVDGLVPIWEWCREVGVQSEGSSLLGEEAWGVYGEEQDCVIEQGFKAGEAAVDVTIGVRGFQIVFGPEPNFARQVDQAMYKRRLVRRRLATPEERTRALQPVAPEVSRGMRAAPRGYRSALPVLPGRGRLGGLRHGPLRQEPLVRSVLLLLSLLLLLLLLLLLALDSNNNNSNNIDYNNNWGDDAISS